MNTNSDLQSRIADVLEPGEQVLYISRPEFVPYFFDKKFLQVLYLFVFTAVFWFFFNKMMNNPKNPGSPVLFFIFGVLLTFGQALYFLARIIVGWYKAVYAITSKRVIIRGGFLGGTHTLIDYPKINDVLVMTGIMDRFKKTGSIRIFSGITDMKHSESGKVYDRFDAINEPYEVLRLLQGQMNKANASKNAQQ